MEPKETTNHHRTLSDLQSTKDFVNSEDGKRFFCSTASLRWFMRCNHDELTRAGAVVKIGRQLFIVRPEFDQALIRMTQSNARLAAEAQAAARA
jgi:hypothetical protein